MEVTLLEEVKEFCKIDGDEEDVTLNSLIEAAKLFILSKTNYRFGFFEDVMEQPNEKVGRLDKRITIIATNDVSEDGWNNSEEIVFHKCWAQLVDIRTRDYNSAVQVGTENQIYFRIRFKEGVTTDMSIRYKDEHYSIVDMLDKDERLPYMYIVAKRTTL